MPSRRSFAIMGLVNWLRLIVFFVILIFGLIVMGLTAHFAEILVPSDLTRFVTVGLVVSIITLIITTTIFLLGIFRTYIYAAQTRVELAWLGVLAVLWMALAVFLSMSADVEIDCADAGGAIQENASVGMTSDEFEAEYRAMQACSFINAILLVAWFLLLLSFAVVHHFSGYDHVWRTPVADYGWLENKLGSKQKRNALGARVRALGGVSSETSLSSEEEIRGRARTRTRARANDRNAIREKAGLPVTLFRPFYELPAVGRNRPQPVRAVTQPAVPTRTPSTSRPVPPPLVIPTPAAARPTTPVRPGPPVRTQSTPQPARQPTPPPATSLSRNVSAKSAQTFMTAKSTLSARSPMTPTQPPRTPVTTTPQRPRTPVNAAATQRPKTPVNGAQASRPPVTPTPTSRTAAPQMSRTLAMASQPAAPPPQRTRTVSQSNVPQRTPNQTAPSTRPTPVRSTSTPPARPAAAGTAQPSQLPRPSSSQRPRPSPIITAPSAFRPAQSPVTPQTARSPPVSTPVRPSAGPDLARTPTPVRSGTARQNPSVPASRPQPVRTASTPQVAGGSSGAASRPPVQRSQTTAPPVNKASNASPLTPNRPPVAPTQTYWQPPPGRAATLDVPVQVGRDGLRNRSRSPAGRMV